MFDVVPRLLKIQEDNFGYTLNSKGKKVINNVGIIQGDGIEHITMTMLAQRVHDLGYAPECVIYGSGGGLMQKVTRDTYKFAQKTSAIKVNGEWIGTSKDPITDPGKKSKVGILNDDRFVTFYEHGKLLVNDSLETIRSRATKLD
jgi:nicotinamide phosphoribosyltransferase